MLSKLKNKLSSKIKSPIIFFKKSMVPLGEFSISGKCKLKFVDVHKAVLESVDSFIWLLEESESFWNSKWDVFWPWHPLNRLVNKPPKNGLHVDYKVIIYRLLNHLYLFFEMVLNELKLFLIKWVNLILLVLSRREHVDPDLVLADCLLSLLFHLFNMCLYSTYKLFVIYLYHCFVGLGI